MAFLALPPAQSPVELFEPTPAPTIYVSGVASIVSLGDGTACATFYCLVPVLDGDGVERQVAVRIIAPVSAFPPGVDIDHGTSVKRTAH